MGTRTKSVTEVFCDSCQEVIQPDKRRANVMFTTGVPGTPDGIVYYHNLCEPCIGRYYQLMGLRK